MSSISATSLPAKRYAINLIEDHRGRLLLLRRAGGARLGAGLWGFCAGHIEPGETAADCSLREMVEEIGPEHRLELLATLPPRADSFFGGGMEIHLFHYRWLSGRIRLNREHSDWAWVTPEAYRGYAVMDGIDEDIALMAVWPREFLDPARLPGSR